jgi:hypothetical protein
MNSPKIAIQYDSAAGCDVAQILVPSPGMALRHNGKHTQAVY